VIDVIDYPLERIVDNLEVLPSLRSIRKQDDVMNSFPIACFFGALATDIAYASTANMLWADFSTWLLAAGLVMGVLAAIVDVVGFVASRRGRSQRPPWAFVIGGLVVLVLAVLNNMVHSRDAWTSVVPLGVALSAVTVVVMLVTAWFSAAAGRRGAGVQYPGVR
jgi:uncharacterized membrane protein